MSTECLYNKDAYICSFDAVVTGCEKRGEKYAVLLDKTAFFPEGGGQPADSGTLNGKNVSDVQLSGDEVIHFCDDAFEVGEKVAGKLDRDERFAVMQRHSGEHLLSGIIHRRYGFENIGFHMNADMITVDFNGQIPPADIPDIEREANKAIWANVASEVLHPDENELAQLDYRSKKAIEGQIRIVRFPGIDSCACCGTHVRRTGEIGIIKIVNCTKAHGGTRIEMVCGEQALRYLQKISDENAQIGILLSAKAWETFSAVSKLLDDKNEAYAKIALIEKRRFESIAESMAGKDRCLLFEDGLSSDGVRDLAIAVMDRCKGLCAVFSGDDINGYRYAVGADGIDLCSLAKEMNKALCGRGGGKPSFIQGSVKAAKKDIEVFLQQFN